MRKCLLGLVMMLFWGELYALPLGNPSGASQYINGVFFGCNNRDPSCHLSSVLCLDSINVRMGYYGDFVYNRNLKIRGEGLGQGKVIRDSQIRTNAGYLVLNLCERFEAFGTLGTSKLWLEQNEVSWVQDGQFNGRLETNTDFSWSMGGRATVAKWCGFNIGFEGQYFQTSLDFTRYTSGGNTGRIDEFNVNNGTKYFEWQIGGGLSYEVCVCEPSYLSMIPYIGIKYARARFDTNDFTFVQSSSGNTFVIFNMESNKEWGYGVGLSFIMCGMAGVTVEGRFGDETALYVNGQFRF